MSDGSPPLTDQAARLAGVLICVDCGAGLQPEGAEQLRCADCGATYEIEAGTARMLPRELRESANGASTEASVKSRTADSFAYEWEAFGDTRPEWWKNFLDYMQPHPPEFFDGISVLDVGTGSGRHARIAANLGARVIAVDLGASIDVARRNLPPEVITVQADAEVLPLEPGSFDFVMSIGVLHHLPDTARALRGLVRYAKPGGHLHVYLYWKPPQRSHRLILRGVTAARRVTTRLPHRLLHALCYPTAAVLSATIVLPYRVMRRFPRLARFADALPLKAYADYPFGVLVNDQFDRFSAPIEQRFTQAEAERMMHDAGLVDVVVLPNNGWVCDGRRP